MVLAKWKGGLIFLSRSTEQFDFELLFFSEILISYMKTCFWIARVQSFAKAEKYNLKSRE